MDNVLPSSKYHDINQQIHYSMNAIECLNMTFNSMDSVIRQITTTAVTPPEIVQRTPWSRCPTRCPLVNGAFADVDYRADTTIKESQNNSGVIECAERRYSSQ